LGSKELNKRKKKFENQNEKKYSQLQSILKCEGFTMFFVTVKMPQAFVFSVIIKLCPLIYKREKDYYAI
jgi:hypothetical protein